MLAGAAVPGAVVTWADLCGIQRASSPAGRYLAAVRTWYEIEDTDGYLAARELLLRRCGSWAAATGRTLSLPLAGALLDSRHFGSDGRLGYWTPSQVRRALLEWIPGRVTAPQEDLLAAPETLRSVLRYLDATGLRDPRGAATAENEAAIDTAANEFGAAVADQERYGPAKTAVLSAVYGDAGIRLPGGLASFLQGSGEDLPAFDAAMPEDLLERQLMLPGLGHERPVAQLPVRLPAPDELADAAERSTVVGQFRALAEWLGPRGRTLTPAKNIRPADARELIALLGTGDEGLKFHSAAELPGLNLVVSWALKARLIRRHGARLLPVAKAGPLLADAEALWQRAFEAVFDIGPAVCRPIWADEPPSPAQQIYDVVVPDLMATIYSMEEPVPVPRLAESVWESVKAHFDLDFLSPLSLMGLRGRVDNDVEHIFDAFEALGAVTTVRGVASEIFSMDLGDGTMLPSGIEPPFEAGQAAALRERLARPARLVALTPLGTRAMRERMLAEGREAGLVGELSGATPAELLGTVAEHYTTSSAPEEIAVWRAAHGGSLDPLVQAVRDCPFLFRRVALLKTLARSVPEGTELLAELIRDPALGPVVLLAERDDLSPQDATPEEAAWIMAGSVLELLEIGGPEAVREQLENLPPAQRKDIVRAVSASGYPAPETLEEFRTLVAEPILHAPARPHAVQGTRRPRPRKPHRR